MSRTTNRPRPVSGLAAAAVLAGTAFAAQAADLAADLRKTDDGEPAIVNWAGPYAGVEGSAGGLFGRFEGTTRGFGGVLGTGNGALRNDTPALGGGFVGRNWQTGAWVAGIEAGVDGVALKRAGAVTLPDTTVGAFSAKTDWLATVRVRGGLTLGNTLLYATIGPAFTNARLRGTSLTSGSDSTLVGFATGAGIDIAVSDHLALGLEYRFAHFPQAGRSSGDPGSDPFRAAVGKVGTTSQEVLARLSWYPDSLGVKPDSDSLPVFPDWTLHGQTTFFDQGVTGFHSPYVGPNSLLPHQARETLTATAFIGRRLWEGADLIVNPEFDQGYGLSRTLGVAGFVNGEAQKAGAPYPKLRAQRYFLRQTIGLGGETEDVKDGVNQIAGTRDVDRLTITAGKFAVGDFFDDNAYAHDPRLTFMNWALWESAAYDFPANLPGFTQGVVVELNRRDWTLRGGFFQLPKLPNNDVLDPRIGKTNGGIVEFEQRYVLYEQAGKLRVGVFSNLGRSASYRQAVTLAALDPTFADVNDAAAATRRERRKTGAYINLEQALTADVGLFARASFNDGRSETMSFTDIDRSVSGGLSVKGTRWNRPDDILGVGVGVNGLSNAHRSFFAAGGLGLLIGDGRLRYGPETVAEAWYSFSLTKAVALSFDYQFVANPAYNRDRGPANFLGTRVHVDF